MSGTLAKLALDALDLVLTRLVIPRLGPEHVSRRSLEHVQLSLERERADEGARLESERRRRVERERVLRADAAIRQEPPPTSRDAGGGRVEQG